MTALSERLRAQAETMRRKPASAGVVANAAVLCDRAADLLEPHERAEAAAEGYDSPEETHRRLVRLLEYVAGVSIGHSAVQTPDGAVPVVEVERIEERLTSIIRDMPANRTWENDRG